MDILEFEESVFIEKIGRSREYLALAAFVALKSCDSPMSERIVNKNAREAEIIFRFLRRKINREIKKFKLSIDKMNFVRLIWQRLPAYSGFYDFKI